MKRIAIILIVCLLCTSLSACGSEPETPAPVTSFSEANFNNNYWFSGDFWAFENNVFYLQDGFYNMGAYWSTNGTTQKLFEESDFYNDSTNYNAIGDIWVSDSYLYFELYTDQEDMLYRYDLKEGTYAPVCNIPYLYRWVIIDDYFIYREHPTNSPEKHSPLCIYNLKDGSTTQVCPDVEEFGIVDGQLRYITQSDIYTLYQYDYAKDCSATLGAFSCQFDEEYDIFNFTSDAVVMLNWDREYERNLVVYSIAAGSTAVYTLPKGIQRMAACDRYAYAVVYDTQKDSSEAVAAAENGIYRISLADGSYEVVERNASNATGIHVISDDRICIIQRRMLLVRSRRYVYMFDYTTGIKNLMTVI